MTKSELENLLDKTSNDQEQEVLKYIENEIPFDETIKLETLKTAYEKFPKNTQIITALIHKVDPNAKIDNAFQKIINEKASVSYPLSVTEPPEVSNARKINKLLQVIKLKKELSTTNENVIQPNKNLKTIQSQIEKEEKKLHNLGKERDRISALKTKLKDETIADPTVTQIDAKLGNQKKLVASLEKDLQSAKLYEQKQELFKLENELMKDKIQFLNKQEQNLQKKQTQLKAGITKLTQENETNKKTTNNILANTTKPSSSLINILSSEVNSDAKINDAANKINELNKTLQENEKSLLKKQEELEALKKRQEHLADLLNNSTEQKKVLDAATKPGTPVVNDNTIEGVELTEVKKPIEKPHRPNNPSIMPSSGPSADAENNEEIDKSNNNHGSSSGSLAIITTNDSSSQRKGFYNNQSPTFQPPMVSGSNNNINMPNFTPPMTSLGGRLPDPKFPIQLQGHQLQDRLRFVHPGESNVNFPKEGHVDEFFTAGKGFRYNVIAQNGDPEDKEYKIEVPIRNANGQIIPGKFDIIILDRDGHLVNEKMAKLNKGETSQVDQDWLNSLALSSRVQQQQISSGASVKTNLTQTTPTHPLQQEKDTPTFTSQDQPIIKPKAIRINNSPIETSTHSFNNPNSGDLYAAMNEICTSENDTSAVKEGLKTYLEKFPFLANQKIKGREQTPLEFAVEKGNSDLIKLLVESGADVKQKNANGESLLHYAAKQGANQSVIAEIIRAGADINAKDKNGQTPLEVAIANNKETSMKYLIMNGADTTGITAPTENSLKNIYDQAIKEFNTKKENFNNAFIKQVAETDSRTTHLSPDLLHNFPGLANQKIQLDDKHSMPAIYYAASKPDLVKELLKNGADPNVRSGANNTTLLDDAISNNDNKLLEVLIEHKVDVNSSVDRFNSGLHKKPIHLAAQTGNINAMQLLIKAGADINSTDSSRKTALDYAIQNANAESIKFLIENGADYSKISNEKDQTEKYATKATDLNTSMPNAFSERLYWVPYADASKKGTTIDKEVNSCNNAFGQFTKSKLEMDLKVQEFKNLMQEAINNNFIENDLTIKVIQIFVQNNPGVMRHKIKVNIGEVNGIEGTPVELACMSGNPSLAQALINKDNVNQRDENGRTMLHTAVLQNKPEIVKLLLQSGADINAVDKNGQTALHYSVNSKELNGISAILINNDKINLNAQDNKGNTALHYANANEDIFNLLTRKGADVTIKNRNGTPAELKGQNKDLETLKTAIQSNDVSSPGSITITPDMLDKTIINTDKKEKKSILEVTIEKGDEKLLEQVLKNATPEQKQEALSMAVFRDKVDLIETIVQSKVNINHQNEGGLTVLHEAANLGNVDMVQKLIQHGADLGIDNNNGDLPIHIAAKSSFVNDHAKKQFNELFNSLRSSGQDMEDIKNTKNGQTIVHMAAVSNRANTLKNIIGEEKQGLELEDNEGYTPIALAAKANAVEAVNVFMKANENLTKATLMTMEDDLLPPPPPSSLVDRSRSSSENELSKFPSESPSTSPITMQRALRRSSQESSFSASSSPFRSISPPPRNARGNGGQNL